MLKLNEVAPHEWEFVYPEIYYRLMDEFHSGCDAFDEGKLFAAQRIFKSVLKQMPDHLDALHHLAMVQSEKGLVNQAADLWAQSVHIGRTAFPDKFDFKKDRLEWGWLENRPFLRCLQGLALTIFEDGQEEQALPLFQELLGLNPNDNQGVRAMAVLAMFKLNKFEEVVELARHYPSDIMPETLYGLALALFKLGRIKIATSALKKAAEILPLVKKELLKSKHHLPRSAMPDRITVGGADEAYYYWQEWGSFWQSDPEILEWLRGRPVASQAPNQVPMAPMAVQSQPKDNWPIRPAEAALVIVDMQIAFVDSQSPLSSKEAREFVPRINELAARCRSLHMPVIFIQANGRPDGSDSGLSRDFHSGPLILR